MRTSARRLLRFLSDHGVFLSTIVGVFVGALFGETYESRAYIVSDRGRELYQGNRND